MTCGIYKIENKLNGKVYIGQSNNIERRWNEHKNNYLKINSKFYKAIQEFGIENFELIILEECSEEELDEKELYYIIEYNSIKDGYNTVYGAPYKRNSFRKITEEEYENLIQDLIDNIIPISELSLKYNIGKNHIYDINNGIIGKRKEKLNYPLRPKKQYKLTEEEANEILNLLINSDLTYKEIGDLYNKSISQLKKINLGKYYHRDYINYPIRPVCWHKLTKQQVLEIKDLLKNTNLSPIELGNKYNVSNDTITAINRGKTYHDNNINYPIRVL